MNKFKSIRDFDDDLWQDIKGQCHLEGVPIRKFIGDACQEYLSNYNKLRERLPFVSKCEICGKTIYRYREKGKPRMIIHHEKPGLRSPASAMLLCESCHRKRHQQLKWGTPEDGSEKDLMENTRTP